METYKTDIEWFKELSESRIPEHREIVSVHLLCAENISAYNLRIHEYCNAVAFFFSIAEREFFAFGFHVKTDKVGIILSFTDEVH